MHDASAPHAAARRGGARRRGGAGRRAHRGQVDVAVEGLDAATPICDGHRHVHQAIQQRHAARHRAGRRRRLQGQRRPRPAQDLAAEGRLKGGKAAGRYTARWTIKAVDGHEQSGSFSFRLRK